MKRGCCQNPEATAAAFTPEGWLRTGDLGHRDADGFFFVTGMPGETCGQEILVGVVLREGRKADDTGLRAFCEQHLGRYKTPKRFLILPEPPRGPSGKVQKFESVEFLVGADN